MTECALAASGVMILLASDANPYRSHTDTARVGGVGYSVSGRAWVLVQEEDTRYKAIVGWDNLTKSEFADQGSPSCVGDPGSTRTPRAPALGMASEDRCDPQFLGEDAKKTGFSHWRSHGVPSMQVVLANSNHGDFGAAASDRKPFILYYTQNWFDRWLKLDESATSRLLARTVAPSGAVVARPTEELLSTRWRSAAFLDDWDCSDLRAGCE